MFPWRKRPADDPRDFLLGVLDVAYAFMLTEMRKGAVSGEDIVTMLEAVISDGERQDRGLRPTRQAPAMMLRDRFKQLLENLASTDENGRPRLSVVDGGKTKS